MYAYVLRGFLYFFYLNPVLRKSKSAFPFTRGIVGMGTFTHIEDQGIVEIVYSDEITKEELISDRELGAKLLAEKGIKRVLVDARAATSKPSNKAIYEHGVALSSYGEFIGVQIAIVTSEVDATDSLLETVATNRGGILRVFESRDDALSWLKGS